ncbi:MAG: tetratricopeptide repeat protein, partial [Thermodesulfovibrionales bacterium]
MTDKTTVLKLAQKYLAKNQLGKAIQAWEEFAASNPDGIVYNTIADLYLKSGNKKSALTWLHKSAGHMRAEGFSTKSRAIYNKILNIDPQDADALLALAELNEEKGLTPDAIKFYLAAVDLYQKRGQKSNMLDIYQRILGLSPT